jgi:hypothetical protein
MQQGQNHHAACRRQQQLMAGGCTSQLKEERIKNSLCPFAFRNPSSYPAFQALRTRTYRVVQAQGSTSVPSTTLQTFISAVLPCSLPLSACTHPLWLHGLPEASPTNARAQGAVSWSYLAPSARRTIVRRQRQLKFRGRGTPTLPREGCLPWRAQISSVWVFALSSSSGATLLCGAHTGTHTHTSGER